MARVIVYNAPDTGIVTISYPAFGDLARDPNESDDTLIERCIKRIPDGVSYKVMEDTDIPEDRTFRNAWEWVD